MYYGGDIDDVLSDDDEDDDFFTKVLLNLGSEKELHTLNKNDLKKLDCICDENNNGNNDEGGNEKKNRKKEEEEDEEGRAEKIGEEESTFPDKSMYYSHANSKEYLRVLDMDSSEAEKTSDGYNYPSDSDDIMRGGGLRGRRMRRKRGDESDTMKAEDAVKDESDDDDDDDDYADNEGKEMFSTRSRSMLLGENGKTKKRRRLSQEEKGKKASGFLSHIAVTPQETLGKTRHSQIWSSSDEDTGDDDDDYYESSFIDDGSENVSMLDSDASSWAMTSDEDEEEEIESTSPDESEEENMDESDDDNSTRTKRRTVGGNDGELVEDDADSSDFDAQIDKYLSQTNSRKRNSTIKKRPRSLPE